MDQKQPAPFHISSDDDISVQSSIHEFPIGTLETSSIEMDLKPAMTTLIRDSLRSNNKKDHLQQTGTGTCDGTDVKKNRIGQNRNYHRVPENKTYCVPADLDVKLGRGGHINNHQGNQMYIGKMLEMQQNYLDTTADDEKTRISQELVNAVCAWGGRFLKEDEGGWYEVPNVVARKKASASLCGRKTKSHSKFATMQKRNFK
jgi:hypothetical protein